jgi:HTH-type transcriptional regulator/antitoxin HigA
MKIKIIRTEAEHKEALGIASAFFDKPPAVGTPDGDHFEVLLMLIEAYEQKQYPISAPDPIEAIKFRMEQSGLTPKDLEPMIGRLNRVYEVLNRTRPLTLPMIRRLHSGLGIPAESLIGELSEA